MGSAAWTGLSRLALNAVALGVTAAMARILEPRDFGLLAMATVFTGLVEQAQDFGVGQALVQQEHVTDGDEQTAFTLALLFSGAFFFTLVVLAPAIASLYSEPGVASVLRAVALTFPIGAFAVVPRSMLRRELSLRGEAIVSVASMVAESAAMLSLAVAGYGVWSLVGGRVVSALATAIGLAVARPWRIGFRLRSSSRQSMLGFGGGVTLSTLLWYGYSNADFFVIGHVLGSSALGTYSMAWKLAKVPWDRIWMATNPLILPLYSRSRVRAGQLGRVLSQLTRYFALLTTPAVAGLGAVGDDVVLFFLGDKWQSAILPLRWLCAYGVARGVLVLLPPVLLATGRIRQEILFNLACFVLLPAGFVVGVRHGAPGVAATWAILYPVLALAWLLPLAARAAQIEARTYLAALTRPFVATALMVAAVLAVGVAVPSPGLVRLIARVLVGAIVYLAAIRVLEGPIRAELRALWDDLRQGLRP